MAEVHIIGMLEGASNFIKSNGLCCKWSIHTGDAWTSLEGHVDGQTHVDIPLDNAYSLWNHPIGISNAKP